MKKRYSFIWQRETHIGSDHWNERVYVGDIRQACDKMLRWCETRNFELRIDEDAVEVDAKKKRTWNEEHIYELEHPLEDWLF